jgi:Tol biopolymer transport system component
MKKKNCLLLFALLGICLSNLQAQYFGRNKAKYKKFDFEVYESPHFEIYHYLKNPEYLNRLTQQSEQWYHLHQEVLQDTFHSKNPIIFYNNHGDFQQTNAISSSVGVGTGGVTEGFKRRVIMPIAMSNQQTNHVLGHEMVHAFQYHLMSEGDSTSLKNLSNIPLWMVEGLAEYISIGRVDAHTAMWMRDAVLNEDVPSIKDLNSGKYFPYRYGQAFWAFLTGVYGDTIIEPFFVGTAKYGLEAASQQVLNTGLKNLSAMWQNSLKNYYGDYLTSKKESAIGKKLLSGNNSGKMNIAPALSPNGKYVMFLSEKNLFSVDLFLADARTGKTLRQIASTTRDGHLDAFSFIESAGTWSPNSKQFAFVAFKKGENVLIIKDIEKGKTVEEINLPNVPAFSNPSWSPDGKEIVVSGLVNGQVDLYSYHLKKKKVRQLTDDIYSEAQAQWSADGKKLVFATDKLSFRNGRTHGKWTFNLAILDIATGKAGQLNIFPKANNLNPVFDQAGNILFLSNRDGFRNLYKYETATGKVFQMTNLMTGISGITEFAPAISTSTKRDRVLYTHFYKGNYTIYAAKAKAFLNKEVSKTDTDFSASLLPPFNEEMHSIVDANLANLDHHHADTDAESFRSKDYQAKFKLDYIGGGAGLGINSGNLFGPAVGARGGVDFLFSDILGNHQLYTGVSLNGEIYDFGGQVAYLNKKGRFYWGGGLSHTPYRLGGIGYKGPTTLQVSENQSIEVQEYIVQTQRLFQEKANVFLQFPFSTTKRFEVGSSFTHFGFRTDQYSLYTDNFGRPILESDREKLANRPGINFFNVNAALVGDNSYFGLTAPLQGYRYRVGVEQNFGDLNFTGLTIDGRMYKYLKPVSLAFRALHYGRYGENTNALGAINNIAYPWFVRGYGYGRNSITDANNLSSNNFVGDKMFVTNFEVRIPFTGPEQLALIKSKFLLSDLNFFLDAGIVWNSFSDFENTNSRPKPVLSAGASVRVNLFGALILEPYWAVPIQKETQVVFGLNIVPGW